MQKATGILIGGAEQTRAELQRLLGPTFEVTGPVPYAEGLETIRTYAVETAFVDLDADPTAALELAGRILRAQPKTVVFLTAARKDPDLILKAMEVGVRGYLPLQDGGVDVRRLVATALDERGRQAGGAGRVIAVHSGKGGSGNTTIAVNVAHRIKLLTDRSVAVVDLDLQMGDVDLFLDLKTCYTVADVVNNIKRLDRTLLLDSLTRHDSGLYALAEPEHMLETESLNGQQITEVLNLLREHLDYVVIDCSHAINEATLAALDLADDVLVVTMQSVPVIRITQKCLDLFRRLSYPPEKLHLILNRYGEDDNIPSEGIEDALGCKITNVVSNDFVSVMDSINRGALLATAHPNSRAAADIDALTRKLVGLSEARSAADDGWIGRLRAWPALSAVFGRDSR